MKSSFEIWSRDHTFLHGSIIGKRAATSAATVVYACPMCGTSLT
jgi:hypothetical protein